MRDEAGLLVGWGIGTATFPALMFQAQARAVIRRDGTGLVEIGAHDMGQGAWTALAQIAADGLGLDIDQVEFRAGSSDLPDAGIAGGSAHTATAGMAIHGAGADVDRQAGGPGHGRRTLAAVRRRQCRRAGARRPAVSAATTRAAARAMPTSSPAPASAEIEGTRQRRAQIRPRRAPTPCMRTARCSPR